MLKNLPTIKEPYLIAFIGPNGSGKTSTLNASKLIDFVKEPGRKPVVLNADETLRDIRDHYRDLSKEELDKVAWNETERRKYQALKLKSNFILDTVGSHESRVQFLKEAKDLGYTIIIAFVATENPNINLKRVKKRHEEGGHDVNKDKIYSRYYKVLELMIDYYNVSDIFFAFDNSVTSYNTKHASKALLRKINNNLVIYESCQEVYWIKKYLLSRLNQ